MYILHVFDMLHTRCIIEGITWAAAARCCQTPTSKTIPEGLK